MRYAIAHNLTVKNKAHVAPINHVTHKGIVIGQMVEFLVQLKKSGAAKSEDIDLVLTKIQEHVQEGLPKKV